VQCHRRARPARNRADGRARVAVCNGVASLCDNTALAPPRAFHTRATLPPPSKNNQNSDVSLYRIPPRGNDGFKSGEWHLDDCIFCGRLRALGKSDGGAEVRFEELPPAPAPAQQQQQQHAGSDEGGEGAIDNGGGNNGDNASKPPPPSAAELFAVCPYSLGGRAAAVEPSCDSSRNFAVRVVDPDAGRAARLGLAFAEREDARAFVAALAKHERRAMRAAAAAEGETAAAATAAAGPVAAAATAAATARQARRSGNPFDSSDDSDEGEQGGGGASGSAEPP
jgi:hypothetical protein